MYGSQVFPACFGSKKAQVRILLSQLAEEVLQHPDWKLNKAGEWAGSSNGRAVALQASGSGFESQLVHMNEELYNWLEKMFMHSNIKKYRQYFHEWIENITEDQIIGFERMSKVNYKYKQE